MLIFQTSIKIFDKMVRCTFVMYVNVHVVCLNIPQGVNTSMYVYGYVYIIAQYIGINQQTRYSTYLSKYKLNI